MRPGRLQLRCSRPHWSYGPGNVVNLLRLLRGDLRGLNLSRFVQPVELDLTKFVGHVPVELFGETVFPRIGQAPYFLSLGPHTFYWFRLEQPAAA